MTVPVHGIESTIPQLQEEYIGAGPGENQHITPKRFILSACRASCWAVILPETLLHITYKKLCVLIMRLPENDDFLSSGLGTGILSEIASHVLLKPSSFTSSQTHHAKVPGHESLYSSLGYIDKTF